MRDKGLFINYFCVIQSLSIFCNICGERVIKIDIWGCNIGGHTVGRAPCALSHHSEKCIHSLHSNPRDSWSFSTCFLRLVIPWSLFFAHNILFTVFRDFPETTNPPFYPFEDSCLFSLVRFTVYCPPHGAGAFVLTSGHCSSFKW